MQTQKKIGKDQFQLLEDLKNNIAALPEFQGKKINSLEFRNQNPQLNQIIGDFNQKIKGSGLELHSFTVADDDYCYCHETGKYGLRKECPKGVCD